MSRGMSRKKMIVLIAKLFSVLYKTAVSHFNYLIKSKQLNDLKCGGHVVAAQATTTNCTAITTQKLLRTHNTTMLAWVKQAEWNGWDNWICNQNEGKDLGTYIVRKAKEEEELLKLKDCFTVNLVESCFMRSEGVLRVIWSAARKKHEKNTSDSCQSITNVRVGSAAGTLAVKAVVALVVGIADVAIVTYNTRIAVDGIVGGVDLVHLALRGLLACRNRSPSPRKLPTPINITHLNHLLY